MLKKCSSKSKQRERKKSFPAGLCHRWHRRLARAAAIGRPTTSRSVAAGSRPRTSRSVAAPSPPPIRWPPAYLPAPPSIRGPHSQLRPRLRRLVAIIIAACVSIPSAEASLLHHLQQARCLLC